MPRNNKKKRPERQRYGKGLIPIEKRHRSGDFDNYARNSSRREMSKAVEDAFLEHCRESVRKRWEEGSKI